MPRLSQVAAVAFGAIAAVSVIYAWQLRDQLEQAALARTALENKQAQLLARITSLEKARPPVALFGAGPQGDAVSLGDVPALAPDPAAISAGPFPANRGGRFARMDSPEIQRLVGIQQKAALDSRFAALFRKLNLNPADLEKFKDLLVEKQTAVADVLAAARSQGLSPRDNPDQIRQLIASSQAEVDATIRSTLGDSAFQQYQDYEKTMPQRGVANQLDQRLSYTATPLTSDQTERLVTLLASAAPSSNPAPTESPRAAILSSLGIPVNRAGAAALTEEVVNSSQSFLSAPQVDALRQIQQEHQAQAQLRQQMQAARSGATATTPAATAGPGRP